MKNDTLIAEIDTVIAKFVTLVKSWTFFAGP